MSQYGGPRIHVRGSQISLSKIPRGLLDKTANRIDELLAAERFSLHFGSVHWHTSQIIVKGVDKGLGRRHFLAFAKGRLGKEVPPAEILVIGDSFHEGGFDRPMAIEGASNYSVGMSKQLPKGVKLFGETRYKGYQRTIQLFAALAKQQSRIGYDVDRVTDSTADRMAERIINTFLKGSLTMKDLLRVPWCLQKEDFPTEVDGRFRPFSDREIFRVLVKLNDKLTERGFAVDEKIAYVKYPEPIEMLRQDLVERSYAASALELTLLRRLADELGLFFDYFIDELNRDIDVLPVYLARDALAGLEFHKYVAQLLGIKMKATSVYQPGNDPSVVVSSFQPDAGILLVQKMLREISASVIEYFQSNVFGVRKWTSQFFITYRPQLFKRVNIEFTKRLLRAWDKDAFLRTQAEILFKQMRKNGVLGGRRVIFVDLSATGKTPLYLKSVLECFSRFNKITSPQADLFLGWSRERRLCIKELRQVSPDFNARYRECTNPLRLFSDQPWPFYRTHQTPKGDVFFKIFQSRISLLQHLFRSLVFYNAALELARKKSPDNPPSQDVSSSRKRTEENISGESSDKSKRQRGMILNTSFMAGIGLFGLLVTVTFNPLRDFLIRSGFIPLENTPWLATVSSLTGFTGRAPPLGPYFNAFAVILIPAILITAAIVLLMYCLLPFLKSKSGGNQDGYIEARKKQQENLQKSVESIRTITKPLKVQFIIPMYKETMRLNSRSEDNPFGEDALRMKIEELQTYKRVNPLFDWRILAIDDNTPYAASERCVKELWDKIQQEYRERGEILDPGQVRTIYITEEQKQGKKGGATLRGLRQTVEEGWADFACYWNCDTSIVGEVAKLINPLYNNEADIAIGSRWCKEAGRPDLPLFARISSRIFLYCVHAILPPLRDIQDTQRGFKMFKVDAIKNLVDFVRDKGLAFDVELLLLAKLAGYRIKEVPVYWFESERASTVSVRKEAKGMFLNLFKCRRHISWRKISFVFVWDEERGILLTQRSFEDPEGPGKWDVSLTETLEPDKDAYPGSGYETAAIRGLSEELGLTDVKPGDLIQIGEKGEYIDKRWKIMGTFYFYKLPKGTKISQDKLKEAAEVVGLAWQGKACGLKGLLSTLRGDMKIPKGSQSFFSPALWHLVKNSQARGKICSLTGEDSFELEESLRRKHRGVSWKLAEIYDYFSKTPQAVETTDAGLFIPSPFTKVVDVLRKLKVKPAMKLADAGCGDGLVLAIGRALGLEVEGYEADEKVFARCDKNLGHLAEIGAIDRTRVKVFCDYYDRLNVPEFDIIYFYWSPPRDDRAQKSFEAFETNLVNLRPGAKLVVYGGPKDLFRNLVQEGILKENRATYAPFRVFTRDTDYTGKAEKEPASVASFEKEEPLPGKVIFDKKDLTRGNISGHIRRMAPLLMVEVALQVIFTVIDMFFLSRLGKDAIAAVSMSAAVLGIMMIVLMAISEATTVMTAKAMHTKKTKAVEQVVLQSLLISLLFSAALGLLGYLGAWPLLALFRTNGETLSQAVTYLKICSIGLFGTSLLFSINALFHGAREIVKPIKLWSVSTVVNIVLDALLIFGLCGFPALGVKGAALATVIARAVASIFGLRILFKDRAVIKSGFSGVRLNLKTTFEMILMGSFRSLQVGSRRVAGFILMVIIASFGTSAVAAYGVAAKVLMITIIFGFGFAVASEVFMGQNLSAGEVRRAKKAAWIATAHFEIIDIIFAAIFIILAPHIMAIFSGNPEIIRIGAMYLRIFSLTFIFTALSSVLGRSLIGAGDTLSPFVITGFCQIIFQIPLAALLSRYMGTTGIWLAVGAANVVEGFLMAVWFMKAKWEKLQPDRDFPPAKGKGLADYEIDREVKASPRFLIFGKPHLLEGDRKQTKLPYDTEAIEDALHIIRAKLKKRLSVYPEIDKFLQDKKCTPRKTGAIKGFLEYVVDSSVFSRLIHKKDFAIVLLATARINTLFCILATSAAQYTPEMKGSISSRISLMLLPQCY
ncbi:MAG: MATE family efflux transporter [Deltaproteobacteria bacterium]|nr:MATE family efflux transporter [Deltaproteobacteria bacterium]